MSKQKRISSAHLAQVEKKPKTRSHKRQREQEQNGATRRQLHINNPEDGKKKGNMMQQVIHKIAQQNLDIEG